MPLPRRYLPAVFENAPRKYEYWFHSRYCHRERVRGIARWVVTRLLHVWGGGVSRPAQFAQCIVTNMCRYRHTCTPIYLRRKGAGRLLPKFELTSMKWSKIWRGISATLRCGTMRAPWSKSLAREMPRQVRWVPAERPMVAMIISARSGAMNDLNHRGAKEKKGLKEKAKDADSPSFFCFPLVLFFFSHREK